MKILEVVYDPSSLFTRIDLRPNWLVPYLLVVGLGIGGILVMSPVFTHIMLNQIPGAGSAEVQDGILRMVRFSKYYGMALTPVLVMLRWSILASLLYTFAVLFGADITYRKMLSVLGHASIITGIDGFLAAVVIRLRGIDTIRSVTDIHTTLLNFNYFIDSRDCPALWIPLENLSLLSIWYLSLLVWGVASVTHLSKAKSAIVVGMMWIVHTAFMIGAALMFSRLGSLSI